MYSKLAKIRTPDNFELREQIVKTFIIVELVDKVYKRCGVGIARCSSKDRFDRARGAAIARGRAEKALYLKLTNQPITHHYMG